MFVSILQIQVVDISHVVQKLVDVLITFVHYISKILKNVDVQLGGHQQVNMMQIKMLYIFLMEKIVM